jgi:hypothetical protein
VSPLARSHESDLLLVKRGLGSMDRDFGNTDARNNVRASLAPLHSESSSAPPAATFIKVPWSDFPRDSGAVTIPSQSPQPL